jgi:hypothetical protein
MRDDLPVWRSLMFVPVTAEKFVRTGADRGADAIILDLEDAVAPSQKEHARTLIEAAVPQVSRKGADVVVRVNRPWRLLVRDLEAAVIAGVAAVMLTKVDSPEHVLACAEIVAELEAERGLAAGALKFIALVENARLLPDRADRTIASSGGWIEPGVGGFCRRCRDAIGAGRIAVSETADDLRGAGGRHPADGLRRFDRGFSRSGGVSRDRAAVTQAGVRVRERGASVAGFGTE